eukprot:CAMPEP_0184313576 /NCGR_PEP_ID=MMETSP1049-20130417/65043_1 /TAXON_ID=77928 /ORGANISM="Proteomonas sulcata, Strain CCMP704" /LENGTH=53 /DNA_ID=CAMNT_0026630929 /DNA_START=604 /DNA_END=761 /DNA_ORIENTATION=+
MSPTPILPSSIAGKPGSKPFTMNPVPCDTLSNSNPTPALSELMSTETAPVVAT